MASKFASNKASASNGKEAKASDKAAASANKSATCKQSIGATALNESAISGLTTIQKPHDSALKDQIAVSVDPASPYSQYLAISSS
jgi:hypothetical protein